MRCDPAAADEHEGDQEAADGQQPVEREGALEAVEEVVEEEKIVVVSPSPIEPPAIRNM